MGALGQISGEPIWERLVGFHAEKFWAVGLAMRGSMPSELLEVIDPLSRAVLEGRSEILKAQIQSKLDACGKPEDVITAVVGENYSSLYMSKMVSEMIDLSVAPSAPSMEKLAEEYVLTLFEKQRIETKLHAHPGNGARSVPWHSEHEAISPWMVGTQVWYRPTA